MPEGSLLACSFESCTPTVSQINRCKETDVIIFTLTNGQTFVLSSEASKAVLSNVVGSMISEGEIRPLHKSSKSSTNRMSYSTMVNYDVNNDEPS